MRKIRYFLSLCLLFACQSNQYNQVIISGKITNPVDQVITILSENGDVSYTDSLDENSNFTLEFQLDQAAYMNFKHGKETTAMYLKPGDNVQLTIDPIQFDETIAYLGSNCSNFLAKKYLLNEQIDRRQLYLLNENEFIEKVNSGEEEMLILLKEIRDAQFVKLQENSIWMQWASLKLNYKKYHEFLTKTSIELSDSFYDFMNNYDINNPELIEQQESYRFLQTYISSQVSNQDNSMAESLEFIASNFTSAATKNKISYDMLKGYIKNESLENIDDILGQFYTINSDKNNHLELDLLASEMMKLNTGNPAIDFTYPNQDGDSISLSNFIGSYVYVDVWATWCGPCKREIPHLVKLEKEYHNKNIVFLSVSVDEEKDYQTWLNMIDEHQLGGVQLFADGWSDITEDYQINGIPRFMLFDPNGNIVTVRATRPSNPETKTLFDELL